jgi:hypothetical protein
MEKKRSGQIRERQTYMSGTSAEGSFETKGARASSRNVRRSGASEKANSIPSFTILIISDLFLVMAAPTNVPDSLEASSLQSERDLPISSWFCFETLVRYRWYACYKNWSFSFCVKHWSV